MMRVLVVADWFLPGQAGGALRTLSRQIPFESREHELAVVTRDRDLGSEIPFTAAQQAEGAAIAGVPVRYLNTRTPRGLVRLVRTVSDPGFDALHLNSLWSPVFALLPLAALMAQPRHGKTVLIAPRGELEPGALSVRTRKKRVVSTILRPILRRPWVLWHASSEDEAAQIRQWAGADARVLIATDQAEPPDPTPSAGSGSARALRVVCVSRIVPKKDVRRLLTVIAKSTADLDVRLYGPLEDAKYWESCEELIARLPSNVRFSYEGVLAPGDVTRVYREADLFLFPTRGENFGHVIAEALAVGCPVVTTPTTYWTPWIDAGAGLTFTDDSAAAGYLDSYAVKLPAQRAAHRAEALSIYTDWYRDSLGASSLFSALADATGRPAGD